MKIDLVYAPSADPTCPWGSLFMLKGFLDAETTYRTRVRDLNIEWLHYMFEPTQMDLCRERLSDRIAAFEGQSTLSPFEQLEYMAAIEPNEFPQNSEVRSAIETFRDPAQFYDFNDYFTAVYTLKRWTRAMSRLTYPGSFTNLARYSFGVFGNPSSAKDLERTISDRELGYFGTFLSERYFIEIENDPPDVIGISIPFRFQLWHSLFFARRIKAKFPHIKLVVGGTALQIQKHARLGGYPNALAGAFSDFDAIVVGEGEEPLLRVLQAWEKGQDLPKDEFADPRTGQVVQRNKIKNVLTPSKVSRQFHQYKGIKYHDLNDIHPPDYSDATWGLYLSPEPVQTYSPTRGCYWDRCAFCESGLAYDRPTSPSRERDFEKVIDDLQKLRKTSRHIYWSVDAIRPAWMVEISRRIRDARLDIRWGAEIRFDRKYSEAEIADLRAGGCLALSVGIESGSNRVLALMDKGADIERYGLILRRMRQNGIAVYPMTFVGFPGETVAEAEKTVSFLHENRYNFAFLSVPATFYLEGHSFVARMPEKYGIKDIGPFKNLEVANGWFWKGPEFWSLEDQGRLSSTLSGMSDQILGILDRPFLGGIDTPHTNFYIERLGLNAVRDAAPVFRQRLADAEPPKSVRLNSPYDLSKIRQTVTHLIARLGYEYEDRICATFHLSQDILAELPDLKPQSAAEQTYEMGELTQLNQWLDVNFSRDRSREVPLYTQLRPSHLSVAEERTGVLS